MEKNKMEVVHQSTDSKNKKKTEEEASALYEVLKELPKPEASMKLSAAQKKWWYWFGLEFVSTKQFSKGDLMHLHSAAIYMDIKCQALKEANSKKGISGFVERYQSGATNVTGYFTAIKKATAELDKISEYFGLSIKDRKKLGATSSSDDNQLNLFDEVLKKLHG